MKDIVVHVLDSVCAANNRDPEATALIEAAKSFGTVETLDNAIANERARWQEKIGELEAKLTSIQDRAVTDEEFEILKIIRKKSEVESEGYRAEISRLNGLMDGIKTESQNRAAQIKNILGL